MSRLNKNNFESYKSNSRQMEYLNHLVNKKKQGLDIEGTAIPNHVFLASLKQSKYNNRPVSSKMDSKKFISKNRLKLHRVL